MKRHPLSCSTNVALQPLLLCFCEKRLFTFRRCGGWNNCCGALCGRRGPRLHQAGVSQQELRTCWCVRRRRWRRKSGRTHHERNVNEACFPDGTCGVAAGHGERCPRTMPPVTSSRRPSRCFLLLTWSALLCLTNVNVYTDLTFRVPFFFFRTAVLGHVPNRGGRHVIHRHAARGHNLVGKPLLEKRCSFRVQQSSGG